MDPDVADRKNLAPFYDALNTAIRQADPDHCIFFESVTWADFGTGFEHVPGGASEVEGTDVAELKGQGAGDDFRNRSVYSFHYYEPPNLEIHVRGGWMRCLLGDAHVGIGMAGGL